MSPIELLKLIFGDNVIVTYSDNDRATCYVDGSFVDIIRVYNGCKRNGYIASIDFADTIVVSVARIV